MAAKKPKAGLIKPPSDRSLLPKFLAIHRQWSKKHPEFVRSHPQAATAAKGLQIRASQDAAQRRANDPAELIKPLTPKTAGALAHQLAGTETDPAMRASQYLQTKQLPDWHAAYKADLQAIEQRQAAAQAQTAGQVQNFANSSSAIDQQQRDQLQQQMAADAAKRGAQVDPQIAATAQAASASRRAGTDSQGALIASQGQTQQNYLLDRERIAGGDLVARQAEQGRVQQGLLAKRGARESELYDKIRGDEWRKLLESKTFQVSAADAQRKADKDTLDGQLKTLQLKRQQAKDATERRKIDADIRRINNAINRDAYQRAHGVGPYKPASAPKAPKPSAQSQKFRASLVDVMDDVRSGYASGWSTKRIRSHLQGKFGVNELIVTAAINAAQNNGTITPGVYTRIKQAGLSVPRSGW